MTITNCDKATCKVCERVLVAGRKKKSKSPDPEPSPSEASHIRQSTAALFSLCEACRKFYCRNKNSGIRDGTCSCSTSSSNTSQDEGNSGKCRFCRFKLCEAVVLERISSGYPVFDTNQDSQQPTVPPGLKPKRFDFTKIPCSICGCSSTGVHFGTVSCDGCKSFFRRSVRQKFKLQYLCKNYNKDSKTSNSSDSAKSLCPANSTCRKCRLQRCLDAGMSLNEVTFGRHTLDRRAEISAKLKKHFTEGTFLRKPVQRRRPRDDMMEPYTPNPNTTEMSISASSDSAMPSTSGASVAPMMSVTPTPVADSSLISMAAVGGFSQVTPLVHDHCTFSNHTDSSNAYAEIDVVTASYTSQSELVSSNATIDVQVQAAAVSTAMVAVSNGQNQLFGPSCSYASSNSSSTPAPFSAANFPPQELNFSPDSLTAPIPCSEWIINRLAESAAYLAPISTVRIVYSFGMTFQDMHAARMRSFETYMRAISEFLNSLPGASQISIEDRITLFTQAFFPVSIAQLSLNFDVERQEPNHFSLSPGETMEIVKSVLPFHGKIEAFLIKAGNMLVTTVFNIKEFALFCALLCLNPETPNLQNPEAVRNLRTRYDLALLQYARKSMPGAEERLLRLHSMMAFYRNSTLEFYSYFRDVGSLLPSFNKLNSPLFNDLRNRIISDLT